MSRLLSCGTPYVTSARLLIALPPSLSLNIVECPSSRRLLRPAFLCLCNCSVQLFRASKMQRFGVKKMQKRLLDRLEDILQVTLEVSVPSLKDEEAKEPIECQRLLSPGSERKISQICNWAKPTTEDTALEQLLQDAERVMRQKIDNVVRMQNTIRYCGEDLARVGRDGWRSSRHRSGISW